MKIRDDIVYRYLCHAPMALAMERSIESGIYRQYPIQHPVLDLGCGEGLFAEMVFAGCFDTGVEPDSHEIQAAQKKGRHRELIQASGDRIPKPDCYYRTIISNSVLEHIPDLKPVLEEVHRLLQEGGHFYFTVPSEYFDHYTFGHVILAWLGMHRTARQYRQFYNAFWKHFHFYSLQGWIDLVTGCGFEVQEAFTFIPRASCLLYNALIPLGLPGKICKRFTGSWTLVPEVRAGMMKPIARMLNHRIQVSGPCPQGGLVFMALTKTG